jgi:hypothetical protein
VEEIEEDKEEDEDEDDEDEEDEESVEVVAAGVSLLLWSLSSSWEAAKTLARRSEGLSPFARPPMAPPASN